MSESITNGGTTIVYQVVRSRKRKTVGIAVYPSGEVRVSAPANMGPAEVRRLVAGKAGWIDRKLREFRAEGGGDAAKSYVDGEAFLYEGREYLLHFAAGLHGPLVTLDDRRLNVVLPPGAGEEGRAATAREAVLAWYRLHAEMAVDRSMPAYCRMLGIRPPPYRVKNLQRRWGSCTAQNRLSFNVKIAMAPLPQLEYVVAHELCHVKIKDHSPRFWALLKSVMPDYEAAKKALRKDGWKYEL